MYLPSLSGIVVYVSEGLDVIRFAIVDRAVL
jgi:hypothetical protein